MIDWHDDGRLLTCVGGTLRLHDGESSTIAEGPDVIAARWDGDTIVMLDRGGRVRRDGEVIADFRAPLEVGALAGDFVLGIGAGPTFVATLAGAIVWRLDPYKHNLGAIDERTSCAVSSTGKHVAIGYETRSYARASYGREGRGWLVIDTAKDRILDRAWAASPPGKVRVDRPSSLAFDRNGRRLAMANPEPGKHPGAIRVGRDERYPREHAGGARAAAIDGRGVIAAFAYPKTVADAPRRVRVDTLEPGAKGPAAITVIDTLWIDPDLDDIVALAFERTSRRIACVDAAGRVDIIPVP